MADFARLPLDRVKAGPLPAGLYEPGRGGGPARLLLAAGEAVTDETLARLGRRGVREFVVDVRHLNAVRTPDGAGGEAAREAVPLPEGRPVPKDALIRELTRPAGAAGFARTEAAAARRGAVAARVDALFRGGSVAEAGSRAAVDGAALREVSVQSVADLTEDFDLFTRLGLTRPAAGGPGPADGGTAGRLREHAVRTAHLALAVGCVLGLRRDELEHLAMGCLIHDAGMTAADGVLWDAPRRPGRLEFLGVTRHPLRTFDLLLNVPEAPVPARMVAYQLHERADGTGYPRRRGGGRIHRLARVAAVAEAYCDLTADRPGRLGLAPHAAVRRVAAGAVRGAFDPDAARAFLETVSVFPLGSTVRLADGRCGRVVEARRDRPAEPVIELWDPLAGRFTGERLALAAGAPDHGTAAVDPDRPRVVAADEPLPFALAA